MMHKFDACVGINIVHAERLLGLLDTRIGERYLLALFIHLVVLIQDKM